MVGGESGAGAPEDDAGIKREIGVKQRRRKVIDAEPGAKFAVTQALVANRGMRRLVLLLRGRGQVFDMRNFVDSRAVLAQDEQQGQTETEKVAAQHGRKFSTVARRNPSFDWSRVLVGRCRGLAVYMSIAGKK